MPLGIKVEDKVVFNSAKEQFAFNEATNISGWAADREGLNPAGWGLTLSAMDMAKIGKLYLNNGTWKERQIVSSEWISESTKVQSKFGQLSYGYLWWIIDGESFGALGDGGDVIYANREKDMVVSITGMLVPDVKDRVEFIKDYIEPMFEN